MRDRWNPMIRNPRSQPRHHLEERGFVSVEIIAAVGMSLMILVAITNVILVQYGRGVIRAAADEGARAGAQVSDNPGASCRQRQDDVLANLGRLAEVTDKTCVVRNGQVITTVSARFPPWVPGLPQFEETATGVSVKEVAPNQ